MADEVVKLLTAEEIAGMRRDLDLFPYVMADGRERVVATLEALLECVETIAEPLKHLVNSTPEGHVINGPMAIKLVEEPVFYRETARTMLEHMGRTFPAEPKPWTFAEDWEPI